jgi:GntR family transcriptional regulator
MFLQIDPNEQLPIYDQVVRQIKFAVASGAVRTGEFVPSVRELARDLAINPNTVARAYRQLQTDGTLVSVRGTGLAVTPEAAERCRQQRLQLIGARLRQAVAEGRQSRLDADQLRRLFEQQVDDVYCQE